MRLLIAFAVSFVIIFASRYLLVKTNPPTAQKPPAPAARSEKPQTPGAASSPTAQQIQPAAPAPTEPKMAAAEQDVTVESDTYRIVFSSRGAVAKSWSLKQYRDSKGNPLDLVDKDAAAEFGLPLSIWTGDDPLRGEINNALFVPSRTGALKAPVTLTFDYSGNGRAARKQIVIPANGYVVEIRTYVWSGGSPVPHQIAWRGGFGDVNDLGMRGDEVDVFYREAEQVTLLNAGKIKNGEVVVTGAYPFAGIEDRFFAAAFLPPSGQTRVVGFHHDVTVPNQEKKRASVGIAVGDADAPQNEFKLFVGPKVTEMLATVHPQLPQLVDYGWFAVVAKPLFVAMRWIHDHIVANYGWSIVLLTIAINFAMFPLKLTSLRSMMKMQRLQPQIRALQDKYKQYKATDPRRQELQQEMMAFYKKNGVNPVGGCLPMLLQMPFLYGFYKVLVVSIEMRHAPWILWVQDLSAPEPTAIKVLPLLMTGTQFLLQKMSPSPSPDPAQQKIMMYMPLMFLFIFWNMSSGLVLYWFTGNVVGILQQWYINKTELHPAAEKKTRGVKKQAVVKK